MPPLGTFSTRVHLRNKPRPFRSLAKPLKGPQTFQIQTKTKVEAHRGARSRCQKKAGPSPSVNASGTAVVQACPRDVAEVERQRSTSLRSRRHEPNSKGESPVHRGSRGACAPDTLTHAHTHTCNVHTPGWG
ncbi:hypothetical protein TREES_T100000706 [Tupaia chinensis]|uniref:Uncharacterized protein n=1 Tax=Tupaia chinensis TaxID=246437 RepID=L9KQ56_TUPCH|nr:hypothetical protein TREES_T100000706 [Tupaia chinensis]